MPHNAVIIISGSLLSVLVPALVFSTSFRKDLLSGSDQSAVVFGVLNIRGTVIVVLSGMLLGVLLYSARSGAVAESAESCSQSLATCEENLVQAAGGRESCLVEHSRLEQKGNELKASMDAAERQLSAVKAELASMQVNAELREGKLFQKNLNTRVFCPSGAVVHCSGASCSIYLNDQQLESWPYY